MVKVVLDTVIFVRCLINPRSRWGSLVFDYRDRYRLVVSRPVLDEILEVLDRPVLSKKFRFVLGRDKATVLAFLAKAEIVRREHAPSASHDPKDDKFLATAKAARADFLVSEDQDLLVLGAYEGTRIVDTATFLRTSEEADATGFCR
jgi:putative PIN family toxin of toxin-antitoxin system